MTGGIFCVFFLKKYHIRLAILSFFCYYAIINIFLERKYTYDSVGKRQKSIIYYNKETGLYQKHARNPFIRTVRRQFSHYRLQRENLFFSFMPCISDASVHLRQILRHHLYRVCTAAHSTLFFLEISRHLPDD